MLVALRPLGSFPLTRPASAASAPRRLPTFTLLTNESLATALLADAPPNHPTPRVEKTHAGESEMRHFSETSRTLNTPRRYPPLPTRALRRRLTESTSAAGAGSDWVKRGGRLATSSAHRSTPILKSKLPALPRLHSSQFIFCVGPCRRS